MKKTISVIAIIAIITTICILFTACGPKKEATVESVVADFEAAGYEVTTTIDSETFYNGAYVDGTDSVPDDNVIIAKKGDEVLHATLYKTEGKASGQSTLYGAQHPNTTFIYGYEGKWFYYGTASAVNLFLKSI